MSGLQLASYDSYYAMLFVLCTLQVVVCWTCVVVLHLLSLHACCNMLRSTTFVFGRQAQQHGIAFHSGIPYVPQPCSVHIVGYCLVLMFVAYMVLAA